MGKLKNVSIAIHNPQPFKPGETLRGIANFTLERAIKVQCILINFCGMCKVKWTKGSGDDEKTYKGQETYFNSCICLFGQVDSTQDVSLAEGSYGPSFQYQLPAAIPSTFSSKHGNIFYTATIVARYNGVFSSDENHGQLMHIVNPVPCPTDSRPVRIFAEGEDHGCCGMGTTESLKFEITTDKSSYCHNDTIVLNGYVMNGSSTPTESVRLKLVQYLVYYGKRDAFFSSGSIKTKEKIITLLDWTGESVDRNGTLNITNRPSIVIPQLPESGLPNCQIIDVSYFLRFQAQLPGMCQISLDSQPMPVFIGNTRSHMGEPGIVPSAPIDESHVNITMPQTMGAGDAAPPYSALTPIAPKGPPPPSYSDATQYGSVFSSVANPPLPAANSSNGNTADQPAQGSYYDWSQSAFTYS